MLIQYWALKATQLLLCICQLKLHAHVNLETMPSLTGIAAACLTCMQGAKLRLLMGQADRGDYMCCAKTTVAEKLC